MRARASSMRSSGRGHGKADVALALLTVPRPGCYDDSDLVDELGAVLGGGVALRDTGPEVETGLGRQHSKTEFCQPCHQLVAAALVYGYIRIDAVLGAFKGLEGPCTGWPEVGRSPCWT